MEGTTGGRLEHVPVTLFGSVMGLLGLAIALQRFDSVVGAHVGFSLGAGPPLLVLVTGWFLFLTVVYALKWRRHPAAVRAELEHPVRMNFFPAYSISLLLLSIGYLPLAPELSRVLWIAGTVLHLGFTLKFIAVWLHEEFTIQSINPAWFIPVVGTILVPVAGVEHASPEISWFFFSVGILYWIVLFTIVMYRIIFHAPIVQKLLPTLFILIAPPAVGFIAWVKLTGELDAFGRILFYFGMFTLLLLVTMIDRFRRVPFFISWWAYTFPLDAATISSVLMYHQTGEPFFAWLAGGLLLVSTGVIGFVAARTVLAARRGLICVPE